MRWWRVLRGPTFHLKIMVKAYAGNLLFPPFFIFVSTFFDEIQSYLEKKLVKELCVTKARATKKFYKRSYLITYKYSFYTEMMYKLTYELSLNYFQSIASRAGDTNNDYTSGSIVQSNSTR